MRSSFLPRPVSVSGGILNSDNAMVSEKTDQNVHLPKHVIRRYQIVCYAYPMRLHWVTQSIGVCPSIR